MEEYIAKTNVEKVILQDRERKWSDNLASISEEIQTSQTLTIYSKVFDTKVVILMIL